MLFSLTFGDNCPNINNKIPLYAAFVNLFKGIKEAADPMLYKKNNQPLTEALFRNPTAEYRATPFWAWNCQLNRELLDREIDYMKDMGFGGFHMHVRVGMSTTYLSDDFMELIKGSVEKAKQNEMLGWLYDEDKWPSGFAGGYVTKKKENRAKYMLFTADPDRGEDGALLARYAVELDGSGCLKNYRRLNEGEAAESVWYAFLKTEKESPWHNMQTYVDTLSKSAIDDFIQITHERYKECIGDEFGEAVPAIFTDEPQFSGKRMFGKAVDGGEAELPFTTDFGETYQAAYGEDLFDRLPELFWELPDGKVSTARYRYHDHVAERFAEAFGDNIGKWCDENGIALTGHMMQEPSLGSQNGSVGDCMRQYRGFGLPGIDMLCDSRELTTAKQAQSAAHQYAREGVLSELYGVTGWDFTFRGHKLQGDWQAALGVTVRVPHLYWVSMHGEAKRDYPASIGHQSPWYREYKYIEDHFARVNAAMTRGKPVVRVGVIHPIESFWLSCGPDEQTNDARREQERRFKEITESLIKNLMEFDFICEANLPQQANGKKIGAMAYDSILVPACRTLRGTTLDFLEAFAADGGKVIFAGEAPTLVDAVPSDRGKKLAEKTNLIGWSEIGILNALAENREVDLCDNKGRRVGNVLYQLREEPDCRWLFVSHLNLSHDHYCYEAKACTLHLRGEYKPELWDTLTGEIKPLAADYKNGETLVPLRWYCHDSVLLRLTSGRSEAKPAKQKTYKVVGYVPAECEVELAEPNVCLLDMPRWRVNGGAWRNEEEILRITDTIKKERNLRNAIAGGAQPWVFEGECEENETVELAYTIDSTVEIDSVCLALEDLEKCEITFNGKAVDKTDLGEYVDSSIRIISLGALNKGENTLVITRPFGAVSTLEACYLLGDFGVEVYGRKAKITAPVKKLYFGDQTRQGLAFYGGNVTYKFKMETDKNTALAIKHFSQPLCAVSVDGERLGVAALAPYTVSFASVEPGEHEIEITAFGNRFNTFGALHSADFANKWHGPDAWRKKGDRWSYEYLIKPAGILVAPEVLEEE